MTEEIIVPKRQYDLPDDWKSYYPTPENAYKALVKKHGKEFDDPEDVIQAMQNIYDLSWSDADEVGLYVFENFL